MNMYILSSAISSFFKLNRKFYAYIVKLFPQSRFHIYDYYDELVRCNVSDGDVILDIGGGKSCRFASEKKKIPSLKIIALDISEEELSYNTGADEKIVADIASSVPIPLNDNSVDIATSSSVLEHLEDLETALCQVERVLKPGGKFISLLPCKFALFALLNQMLPHRLSRKILFSINPESKGVAGFRAYYNKCYYPALKNLLLKNGFGCVQFSFGYHQSDYYSFFVPFALVSLFWDFLMYVMRVRPCCAYICFVAEKRRDEKTKGDVQDDG